MKKGRSGGDVLPHLPHHDDRTIRFAAANSAAVAEYNEGLGGKKAAKLFTNRERNDWFFGRKLIRWSVRDTQK